MPLMKRCSWQKWDGDLKNITKNCIDCKLKVDFFENKICAWGVAFKYIVGETPTRKCEYFGKEHLENNSYEYVLFAKKNNLFGRAKNYKKLKSYPKQLEIGGLK